MVHRLLRPSDRGIGLVLVVLLLVRVVRVEKVRQVLLQDTVVGCLVEVLLADVPRRKPHRVRHRGVVDRVAHLAILAELSARRVAVVIELQLRRLARRRVGRRALRSSCTQPHVAPRRLARAPHGVRVDLLGAIEDAEPEVVHLNGDVLHVDVHGQSHHRAVFRQSLGLEVGDQWPQISGENDVLMNLLDLLLEARDVVC
eukprot:scaffold61250_cov65-Phaeocystis_antarctica.AAC.6